MTQPTKTTRTLRRLALLALCSPLLSACVTTTPIWDKQFGQALSAVNRAQMVNPDGPADQAPLSGVDGKAAVTAMNNYDRSLIRMTPAGGSYGSGGAATGVGMGSGYGDASMMGSGSR